MRPLLAFLLCASLAHGQTLTLPKEVQGQPGAFVEIPATTDCQSVQWYVIDPGLNLFPISRLADTRAAVVTSLTRGRYRLLAYSAKADKATPPAVCVVVIGDVPPGPGPGPTPPGPAPAPSLLAAALQPHVDADLADRNMTNTKAQLATLASIYKQGATMTGSMEIRTAGELYLALKKAAEFVLPRQHLGRTRAALAKYLDERLPTKLDAPLSEETRDKAKEAFTAIGVALEELSR